MANVDVPICEVLSPFPVFQAILELPFIPVSIDPDVGSPAVGFADLPFTEVGVTSDSFPVTFPVLDTVEPLAVIEFTVWPEEFASAVRFAIEILAFILSSLLKSYPLIR